MSRKMKFIYAFILGAWCLPGLSFAVDFACDNALGGGAGGSTPSSVGGDATVCGQDNDAVQTGAAATGSATAFGNDNGVAVGAGAFADDGAADAHGIRNFADSTNGGHRHRERFCRRY